MIQQNRQLQVTVWEDQGFYWMARVLGEDGEPITQNSFTTVTYTVYDRNDDNAVVTTGSLTIGTVIFNTLQTPTLDPRWTVDRVGYNFGAAMPASAFPTGNNQYRVEVVMTPNTGEVVKLYADVSTLETVGS
jgi:hypothetical protein